jgi:hypothetical protein
MPRRVDSADVFLSPDSDSSVFIHELFHAGGLSHTCTVPSIMATEFSEQEIRRCISLRRQLGMRRAFVLSREIGPADIAALEIVVGLTGILDSQQGRSIIWLM